MYENLVAVRRWDRNTNKILYDENLFDQNTNKWNEHNGKSLKPSSQTAYKVYRQILNISEDKLSALVSMSIEHKSPYIAEKWMNLIIKSINDYMRDLDKKVAQNSIDYLNKTFLETSLTEIKDVVSRLIETQIQTLTLAEANKDYIFKPLASPIAPERKSKPSRATTCITITMLGFVFSLLLSAFLHYKNISMASNPKKPEYKLSNKIKITVVGSGYVGMSLAVLLSQKNDVTILEIDKKRVELVNNKQSTVQDSDIQEFLNRRKLNLEATTDKEMAYNNSKFIIVATPTNYDTKTKKFDTSSVDSVISDAIKHNNDALIVIKSTLPVGHTKLLQKKYQTERIVFLLSF